MAIALATAEGQQIRRAHQVSAATVRAVARADAAADYRSGRGVATAHATVARRIRRCPRSVAAARAVHGRRQVRAASTRALTLPRRAWTIYNLPRRGKETPTKLRSRRVTKRAHTRARAARPRNRPLWRQRLAAGLAQRLPWLARGHIGHLIDALARLPLTPPPATPAHLPPGNGGRC